MVSLSGLNRYFTPLQPHVFLGSCVYILEMCAHVCVCNRVYWHVCVFIVIGSAAPLVAAKERRSFSFLISSFISALFFPPNISPRLPSSHPNQTAHRPLPCTPCPGSPLCTAEYLRSTKTGLSRVQMKTLRNHLQDPRKIKTIEIGKSHILYPNPHYSHRMHIRVQRKWKA